MTVIRTSDAKLPAGWSETQRHGEWVRAARGHESAVFHIHDAPRHGTRSAPPTVHYCEWVGRRIQCCACGHADFLPDPTKDAS